MICKVCNSSIPDDAVFCTVCGTPVADNTQTNNTTDTAQQTCPVCGAPVVYGSNVCANCGTVLGANPNPVNNNFGSVQAAYTQKSKVAAVLFALFFGAFGIHNFYLGYTNKAILQLVLGIACCGFVSGIWAFVEAIQILTDSICVDANGVPLGK